MDTIAFSLVDTDKWQTSLWARVFFINLTQSKIIENIRRKRLATLCASKGNLNKKSFLLLMRGRRYVLFNILKIGSADVGAFSVRHPPLFPLLTTIALYSCECATYTILKFTTIRSAPCTSTVLRMAHSIRNDIISFHH